MARGHHIQNTQITFKIMNTHLKIKWKPGHINWTCCRIRDRIDPCDFTITPNGNFWTIQICMWKSFISCAKNEEFEFENCLSIEKYRENLWLLFALKSRGKSWFSKVIPYERVIKCLLTYYIAEYQVSIFRCYRWWFGQRCCFPMNSMQGVYHAKASDKWYKKTCKLKKHLYS